MQHPRTVPTTHSPTTEVRNTTEPLTIENPSGSVVHNPRAVSPNSRRILERLTKNVRPTGSAEFGEENDKRVLVLSIGEREFDVVLYRKASSMTTKRRFVQLAMLFIVSETGDFYPVRYLSDPPLESDLASGGIATQEVGDFEQRQLAGHADDWLPTVERLIDSPPVAQAG